MKQHYQRRHQDHHHWRLLYTGRPLPDMYS
ncbi:hypothetical protein CTAM01_17089 [Colletotrichum tamarilloi]|uniref:Uncharacterized protein n=1 Tax=Colletotrichum tamarilloi TaxID=1209934 RepID=A0ABQ9QGR6_9PEZI|nr:uncharacterized protein CTAM01_17089 [Colletotrichum tamarilloi]KAK1463556.1 hypothetical protein CTAM01_17089 [Colletotrichum tamarilloi]